VRTDNASAINLYRKLGYRQFGIHHDYYEDHMDALRFEKRLVQSRPDMARVPYYEQTLRFTCGPAALLMAMNALDPQMKPSRAQELRLWREATTIFMTSGHGGCGPYGLALSAWHRGFDVEIFVNDETTLLVDTYDIQAGVERAVAAAGPELGAIRIDSGDLGELARQAREQLDALGARATRIVLSGDLDEYAIAALRAEPVDAYGVGTSVVTGSGAPTAGMVYKLVEVDGISVAKRSSNKESRGGRKEALRLSRPTGTVTEEVVHPAGRKPSTTEPHRVLTTPLVRDGQVVADMGDVALAAARERVAAGLHSLPWEGLALSAGDPAIPTQTITS